MAMTVQMLLRDETCWTRGAFARDRRAQEVPPQDPAAVRWCVIGAIRHCYRDDNARAHALSQVAGCILRHYGTRGEVCWKGTALEVTTYFNDAEERFASRAAHFAAVRRVIAEADI